MPLAALSLMSMVKILSTMPRSGHIFTFNRPESRSSVEREPRQKSRAVPQCSPGNSMDKVEARGKIIASASPTSQASFIEREG